MRIKILYILLIMFSSTFLVAQNKEVANLIASADKAFEQRNYYGAAKLYEEALKFDQKMFDVVWKAAESYRFDNDYVMAAVHYRLLADKVPEKYTDAMYYYAAMLKANEEYVRAQYFYQKYLDINGIDSVNILVIRAQQEVLNCEFAWKMYNRPNGISVYHCDTNINSVYSDFSSGFLNDSTFSFSSIKPLNDTLKDYSARLYTVDFFDKTPVIAKLLDSTVNIKGFDIANPHFVSEGSRMYFTKSDIDNGGNSYIYYCDYIENKWSEPVKLPDIINKPNYNSTQPYLVERQDKTNILVWSSNRPEGEGGYDLYYCEILPDKSYGYIRNLGRPIFTDTRFLDFYDTTSVVNTPGNEITPYYNVADSLLYFSSDWFQNMGGYDIFYIKGNFRVWDTIKNIGYPINSAQNDFYYKIYPKQYKAVFSSNRKGALSASHQSCCNDIYYHDLEQIITEEVIVDQTVELLTTRTKLLVPIALYFHNDQPNANTMDTVTELNYSTTFFDYMKLLPDYQKSYSKGLPKSEKIAAIDSVDYYFSYYVQENYNKLLEFTNLMKELLINGQSIVITIKGYTSPLNTVEYNNNLAKRRISSLVNYFGEFENGFFKQYLDMGLITYEFVAFGKTLSDGKVSDDPNDPRNSIYSPAASRERRIEIIAISVENIEQ